MNDSTLIFSEHDSLQLTIVSESVLNFTKTILHHDADNLTFISYIINVMSIIAPLYLNQVKTLQKWAFLRP